VSHIAETSARNALFLMSGGRSYGANFAIGYAPRRGEIVGWYGRADASEETNYTTIFAGGLAAVVGLALVMSARRK